MEPTTPARALVVTGAALLALVGPLLVPASPPLTAGPATTLPAGDNQASDDGATTGSAGSVLARSGARARPGRTTARWSGSIRVGRQSAVDAAYTRSFAPGLDLGTGWTGSHAGCRAGSTSAASRAATLRAVNFVRSMSGLAPVRFSPVLNARSQQTALLMSANESLSHTPPRSWRCWSASGAANAGRSNLALSYPSITSAGLVELYLREPGQENGAVGHRRWLLNPYATTMGTGSTQTANAMTVIGPQAARRPNPAWVSWPTAGYFPKTLEPGGRWSLSAGHKRTDFRRATVQVYRDGQRVRATKLRVHDGYAQPTLVWQLPAETARTGTFTVVVRGVRRTGSTKPFGRTYRVRMFTPSS